MNENIINKTAEEDFIRHLEEIKDPDFILYSNLVKHIDRHKKDLISLKNLLLTLKDSMVDFVQSGKHKDDIELFERVISQMEEIKKDMINIGSLLEIDARIADDLIDAIKNSKEAKKIIPGESGGNN